LVLSESCDLTFYGSSLIIGPTGEIISAAGRDDEAVLMASFDFE
jgi:N-carbamoylputrescine amidase